MIGLSFKGKCILFDDLSFQKSDYSETILFDLENNTTHWKIGRKSHQLGNPDDKTFYEQSFFDYLYRNCRLYKESGETSKQDLDILFKELLTQLSAKMNKLKYSKQSLYTNYGSIEKHGRYLPQIFNIAYRIAFPDCYNLPNSFSCKFDAPSCPSIGNNYQTIKTAISNGTDSITAIITATELPNTKLIRKIVTQNILSIERLKMIFRHIKNYDNAMKIWNACEYSVHQKQELVFLKLLTEIYDETQLVNYYLKRSNFSEIKRLYDYNSFSPSQLIEEKVKFSDLHNWCVEKNKIRQEKEELLKTRDPETKFELPAAIVRRLEMQRDIFSFFLPETQAELTYAGDQLHNCLRTYDRAMENKSDTSAKIVLVADEFGKLVAAVKVENFIVTEAKLKYNKPAKQDHEINNIIIQWANSVKLTINTNDIDQYLQLDTIQMAA